MRSTGTRALPYTGMNLGLVLELAAGLLGAGLVLVLSGRTARRPAFAGMGIPAFLAAARTSRRSVGHAGVSDEVEGIPRSARACDYRVVVPGVGGFSTVAEADRFIEARGKARRRESIGRLEEPLGYRVVRTEFGTFASARGRRAGK